MSANIVITPNTGGAANPNISFSGTSSGSITLQTLPQGQVAFQGNAGTLFNITDSLSGSIFSANDMSGLPILEVFSNDLVVMGKYGTNAFVVNSTNVGIGTATPAYTLAVSGTIQASGNVGAYSDERIKTNWRDLGNDFIERFSEIKSGVYDRTDTDLTQVGVGVQSLKEVLPEAVLTDKDGNHSVTYGNAALAVCVELAKEVVKLRKEIETLKNK